MGVKVNARVSWVPSAGVINDNAMMSGSDNRNSNNNNNGTSKNEIIGEDLSVLYAAEIAIIGVDDVAELPDGRIVLAPPRLASFFVDTLSKK